MVMTNQDYFTFFKNMFEIWIKDNKKVRLGQITEIYEEFKKCIEPNFKLRKCSCSGNCFENFVSLDMDGELYGCNRNYKNKAFYYGNINNIDMEELSKKTKQLSINRQRHILKSKCKNCLLFDECKGGCPANAFTQHKEMRSSDDYFCEANRKIREYMVQRVNELGLVEEYKEGLRKKKENVNK